MANKYNFKFTTPPAQSPKWGSGDSLGTKIEKAFIRFAQGVISWGHEFFAELMVDIFDASMKILRPGALRMMGGTLDWALGQGFVPDDIKDMIRKVKAETGEAAIIGIVVTFISIIFTIFGGLFAPVARRLEHISDVLVRSWIPQPNDLVMLERIGAMKGDELFTYYGRAGVEAHMIERIKELGRQLPSMGELFNGLWRGEYSKQDFDAYLKRMGYNDKDTAAVFELTKNIPPLSDLLLMMRREAFQDDISAKYGYEEEYPDRLNEFLEKLGYDKSWGKLYYRSGWTVPSPTMGYEMLHRGIIDRKTLDDLLKIADFPPYWREKLMQISYSTFTRVDIRRMYQTGVLNEDEVYQAHLELGYNDEKAKKLTQFVVSMVTQDERDLTKTDILNLYEEGLTDRGATSSNLIKMGYDAQEAEETLKLSDVTIAKAARTDLINYSKERFLAKVIDENGARSELTQAGLKAQSVDRYILQWQRSTEIESALPSMADIKKWYAGDYISEMEYRAFLAKHRHTPANIEIYVKQANDTKLASEEPPQENV